MSTQIHPQPQVSSFHQQPSFNYNAPSFTAPSLGQTLPDHMRSVQMSNATGLTDPHSLYRQVFNRDLNFFLYVLDHTDPPFLLKLHVSFLNEQEMSMLDIKGSALSMITAANGRENMSEIVIEQKILVFKRQAKIFIRILQSRERAKKLFEVLYRQFDLPLYDF